METLRYVVLVNGLLAVVGLAYYVLLRRVTFFSANRLALWLGVAGAFILPLLELPDWRPQPIRTAMQRTAQAIVPKVLPNAAAPQPDITITFPNGQTLPAFQKAQTTESWSWQYGMVGVYVLGVLWLLIRFGNQLLSLRKLIRQSAHDPYDDFILVRNKAVTSPFSFFRWVVLNPDQHTPDELEQILRHERVHVRDWHSVDMLGAELVCIVFWINPAAYLFRHLLHQTLEFSADRAVLSEGIDAKLYQYNLLRVSLSERQSAITNHFNKSQLKARIDMLNRPTSPKKAWLKYPVLCFAALIVATGFARPRHIESFSKYVPKSIAETVETFAAVTKQAPIKDHSTSVSGIDQAVNLKPAINGQSLEKLPIKQASIQLDSTKQQPKKDSTRVSLSRYMIYQGDYLYWIVTPKTSFDDFAVMKQEFTKNSHIMQLNEIKYDPLFAYINRIVFSVVRPTGGSSSCNELNDDYKPISSIAGYIGIGPKTGGSGTGGLRYYKNEFPESLRTIAVEDEAAIAEFRRKHRIDYLIQEGNQKFKDLGSGASTYTKAFFQNKSTRSSGLIVNSDGSLAVSEELGAIRVFINNEPVEREAVNKNNVNQLYSVIKKSQYDPARKESFTSALLIYTTEDN